jgi:four helix bundle protein
VAVKDFRRLKVWEKAHHLTLWVYKASTTFPREELYGLTSQIRRSSASIPTNIAEGCGRGRDTELARFFQIAMGSASELEYLILLAKDLNLLNTKEFENLTREVVETKRILTTFIKRLRTES